jgi:streptogramin lyase
MDTWKDEVINRYTTAIEEVLPDGQMLANGQRMMMDAQGRLLKRANPDGSVSKFEPSQDLWWSNPKRGESRDLRFTETIQRANGRSSEIEWKGSTSVGKAQKIDTPAGEFEVLPIESSGWAYEVMVDGLRSTKWSRTVWYSTKLGHPVAIDIQDADRLGKLLKRERVELLHAQASRAATP